MIGETRIELVDAPAHRRTRPVPLAANEPNRPSIASDSPRGQKAASLAALESLLAGAANLAELFASAASLAVDPGGLVAGFVLRRRSLASGGWDIVGASIPQPERGVWFDLSVADRLLERPATWCEPWSRSPVDGSIPPRALRPRHAVAPWFDPTGRLAGAVVGLLGDNHSLDASGSVQGQSEWLESLAIALTRAAQRFERRVKSEQRRARLERWLSPTMARRTEGVPRLDEARTRDVTVLAAGLRSLDGEGRAVVGPAPSAAYRIAEDALAALLRCVVDQSGTIIDSGAEGLVAAWNAPFDQTDDSERACRAALAMVEAIAPLSMRLATELGWRLTIGVGVESGGARVGIVRGRWPEAYAVRGEPADLATQLSRAAGFVGGGVLSTQRFVDRVGSHVAAERLATAVFRGYQETRDVYFLAERGGAPILGSQTLRYREGLAHFEAGRFDAALRSLRAPLGSVNTGPAEFLTREAIRRRDRQRVLRLPAAGGERIVAIDFARLEAATPRRAG
jgi:hypothetical protein